MTLAPKNSGVWYACTTSTITYIVLNPNNVDYYMTLVYNFGGTEVARRNVDESTSLPPKGIYARDFHRRSDFKNNPSIDLTNMFPSA
ncbi:15627_t:CDS:2 [Dentiscutata heterogama]|uniref:15627_t:CDS:1 n=1 Tax=Dentiscutata heterogama TaxID=1316150 RepID=A0ACA9M229_9GLOM|nr:15627_t:CDS:2 [Dentiscutata heterogama]